MGHTITNHGGRIQGTLVHNNPPPDSELASCHGERAPSDNTAARAHRPTASTTAPIPPPSGRPTANAGSSSNAQRTKCTQIRSASSLARRSQPRTVESGNPNSTAIRR